MTAQSSRSNKINRSNRPNILFFLAEHHRWDWLGSSGTVPVHTPTIDRLSREGVRFSQCRCNSPLCAPSRAGIATGLRYHRAGVPDNKSDLDPALPTFMKALRQSGYGVATCGKTDLHKKSHLFGLDGWSERLGELGFTDAIDMCGKRDSALVKGRDRPIEPYMAWLHEEKIAEIISDDLQARKTRDMDPIGSGQGICTQPFPFDRKYQIDDFCGEKSLELLDRLPRSDPWFLQINWGSAHPPFDAAPELLEPYASTHFMKPIDSSDTITDHTAVRRQYAAMLTGMDEWMARILDSVEARGDLDNTIVVYSADHGEMLGDHDRWNKSVPYEPSVRIPLIVAGPGIDGGRRSDALVESIDLAATFLDVADAAEPDGWDAKSIGPILEGRSEVHRSISHSALGNWSMAVDGRYKCIISKTEEDRLFDLDSDPNEQRDVKEENPERLRTLRAAIVRDASDRHTVMK